MAWGRGRRGSAKPAQTSEEYAKQFAETLIKQIEEGCAPWQKTWEPGQRQLPRNIESEREYRGGNTLVLMATAEGRGYGDSRWGTYRQIIAAGGQVRKGERATRITLYKPVGESRQQSGDRDEAGDREKEDGRGRRAIVQRYAVFNIDQADGIEPERTEAVPAWKAIQEVEKVLEKGAPMRHVNGDRAYYNLARDLTTLPERAQFKEARDYYLTALHEAGHSTGHPSRMDRESLAKGTADGHGSPAYAHEELRAEISSMMTGDRIGMGHKPQHGAAYVKSWVATLKDDPSEILRAANDATRISHYLYPEKERELEPEREADKQPVATVGVERPEPVAVSQQGVREEDGPRAVDPRQGERDGDLFRAIDSGDVAAVHTAIDRGGDVDARLGYHQTALSAAVDKDSEPVVRALLERGADANIRAESGATPLHDARLASKEVFDRLAEAGAGLNESDELGRTPLHIAATRKLYLDATQRLLAAGADPNARSHSGQTPLHGTNDRETVDRLIQWGADPNAADKMGQTPLHLTVSDPDSRGGTRYDQTIALLNGGADPNATTNRGETPLHRAALSLRDSEPTVHQLLEHRADPHARDELGNTALHYAAGKPSLDRPHTVERLIEAGAHTNARNLQGATPLHDAARHDGDGQARAIQTLLKNGADRSIRNTGDQTPGDLATSLEARQAMSQQKPSGELTPDNGGGPARAPVERQEPERDMGISR